MVSAILRFPGERLADFTCSFGTADISAFRLVGTKGDLRMDPACEYSEGLHQELTVDGKRQTRHFTKRDQVAAEIEYFSRCVLDGREPEPSGQEGLADVRVIRALMESPHEG